MSVNLKNFGVIVSSLILGFTIASCSDHEDSDSVSDNNSSDNADTLTNEIAIVQLSDEEEIMHVTHGFFSFLNIPLEAPGRDLNKHGAREVEEQEIRTSDMPLEIGGGVSGAEESGVFDNYSEASIGIEIIPPKERLLEKYSNNRENIEQLPEIIISDEQSQSLKDDSISATQDLDGTVSHTAFHDINAYVNYNELSDKNKTVIKDLISQPELSDEIFDNGHIYSIDQNRISITENTATLQGDAIEIKNQQGIYPLNSTIIFHYTKTDNGWRLDGDKLPETIKNIINH